MIKVIAGKYKGQHLVSFKADHIRPTLSQVKETLFNKLMYVIEGAKVLDLFCGTGNLGIEALSRGASHVTFVEKNIKSINITRENLEKLKVPKDQYTIIKSDVISFLKKENGDTFDVILIDPPFTEKMAHEVLATLSNSNIFTNDTLIAIESLPKERMDEKYQSLQRIDAKKYSDKVLSLFQKTIES